MNVRASSRARAVSPSLSKAATAISPAERPLPFGRYATMRAVPPGSPASSRRSAK
jgi:hypothetical protein